MEWTPEHIAELEQLVLRPERGGHERSAVDLLVGNTVACMRAGRQIPDPAPFALPTKRLGSGYARADVRRLLERLHRWRSEWTPAVSAPDRSSPEPAPRTAPSASSWRWTQSQIDWVRDRKFTVRRGGYDTGDVDDFLDAVIVAMAHRQRLPEIHSVKFDTAGLKQGYVYTEVDDFLDQLAAQQPERG